MTSPFRPMIPALSLESMDGSLSISLDARGGIGWTRMPGATGLQMPPVDIASSPIPSAPGSIVQDVRVPARPVFVPIYGRATETTLQQMRDELHQLVDPLTVGSFKLVGTTDRGVREMVVHYEDGLDGADGIDSEGLSWCKLGLRMTAYQPYARAREDRTLIFTTPPTTPEPFLGAVGGTDAPWPRALVTGSTIGEEMEVVVDSEIPVYPELRIIGKMGTFDSTLSPIVVKDGVVTELTDQLWSVSLPLGVPAGSTFTLVTDPRARSARLDGALAAGRIARGSTLRPFYPGLNTLDVEATDTDATTAIYLSWRNLYRSIW